MRRRSNAWHDAIVAQLRVAVGPLTVDQIWQRMAASGFQHASAKPRQTLGARIAELVEMETLEWVDSATYRLAGRSMTSIGETRQEARFLADAIEKLGAP